MKSTRSNKLISEGFSLLELLVVITIIGILSAYGLPKFRRNIAQGQVDRYTQFVESGLFSLRTRLGQLKSSCSFSLDQDLTTNSFGAPGQLLEFQQPDGSRSSSERLKCCKSVYWQLRTLKVNHVIASLPLRAAENPKRSKYLLQKPATNYHHRVQALNQAISLSGFVLDIVIKSLC